MDIKKFKIDEYINDGIARSICLGYFDAIHLGHQKLIKKCIEDAKRKKIKSTLISFDTNPKSFINKKKIKEINTLTERLEIIEYFGIDEVILLHFDNEFADLTIDEFMVKVLDKLNPKSITIGFDFTYGKKGSGNAASLKQQLNNKCEVNVIQSVNNQEGKISSTMVSQKLQLGKLSLVNNLLGYMYFIEGKVVKGSQIGRTIGFPTANLDYDSNLMIIKNGIYLGVASINGKLYKAMCNIGVNPSINKQKSKRVEVHILNFDSDIYGDNLRFYFNKFVTFEKKYENKEELIDALGKYKELASKQEVNFEDIIVKG